MKVRRKESSQGTLFCLQHLHWSFGKGKREKARGTGNWVVFQREYNTTVQYYYLHCIVQCLSAGFFLAFIFICNFFFCMVFPDMCFDIIFELKNDGVHEAHRLKGICSFICLFDQEMQMRSDYFF